ncbi:MAG: ATP-binding cassette domain-containing protein [Burkholderiales bacterium]|nr:ATP-binding cassette domain-containing protein [Burkholderiales bacterium]
MGYLPQSVDLLEATVAENISRLRPAAEDANRVIAAAQAAGAHDMILRLPQGYETSVGPDGTGLSGGQRQLVGLARALFGGPKLVVLDEPNANLDSSGEQALVTALEGLKRAGTTVVFVTHKPSLLRAADKVLVLDAGQVRAFGPRPQVLGGQSGAGQTQDPQGGAGSASLEAGVQGASHAQF